MTRVLVASVVLPIFAGVVAVKTAQRFLSDIGNHRDVIAYASGDQGYAKGLGSQARSIAAPLGFFESPAGTILARIDSATLGPGDPRVPIGEYHWAAAVSPDGSRLAVATGGRGGGIQIVDLQQMQVIHSVTTGIAAEALAWLTPNRLVGALQCNPVNSAGRGCGIVLVDSGRIVRRWPDTEADVQFLPFQPPLSPPKPVARTSRGVMFLLGHATEVAPARLVLINDHEEFRSVSLPPIRIGQMSRYGRPVGPGVVAGWAVDHAGERAFVVAGEPTVAEIDLTTMSVRYHDVQGLKRRGDPSRRSALWLDDGRIAIFGEDVMGAGEGRVTRVPAGVTVIDTTTWRAQTIDARASRAAFSAGTLLVYGGDSLGLTGYGSDRHERFRLFNIAQEQESIVSVHFDGASAYVVTIETRRQTERSRVRVVDVGSGTVVREGTPAARLVDLIR